MDEKIRVLTKARRVRVEFADKRGTWRGVEIGDDETADLIAHLAAALRKVGPQSRLSPLRQRAIASGKHPNFEIGVDDDEDLMIAFQMNPLPAFRFGFSDAAAKKLADGINEVLSLPRGTRLHRPN